MPEGEMKEIEEKMKDLIKEMRIEEDLVKDIRVEKTAKDLAEYAVEGVEDASELTEDEMKEIVEDMEDLIKEKKKELAKDLAQKGKKEIEESVREHFRAVMEEKEKSKETIEKGEEEKKKGIIEWSKAAERKREKRKERKKLSERMNKLSELMEPYLEIKIDPERDAREWIEEKSLELHMEADELEKKVEARIRLSISLDCGEMELFSWDIYEDEPKGRKIIEGLRGYQLCSFLDILKGLESIKNLKERGIADERIKGAAEEIPNLLIRLNDSTYLVPHEYVSELEGVFNKFDEAVKSLYTDDDPDIKAIKAESREDFIKRTSEEWRI